LSLICNIHYKTAVVRVLRSYDYYLYTYKINNLDNPDS